MKKLIQINCWKQLGRSQQHSSLKNQVQSHLLVSLLHILFFHQQTFYSQIENPSSQKLLLGMLLATCISKLHVVIFVNYFIRLSK